VYAQDCQRFRDLATGSVAQMQGDSEYASSQAGGVAGMTSGLPLAARAPWAAIPFDKDQQSNNRCKLRIESVHRGCTVVMAIACNPVPFFRQGGIQQPAPPPAPNTLREVGHVDQVGRTSGAADDAQSRHADSIGTTLITAFAG